MLGARRARARARRHPELPAGAGQRQHHHQWQRRDGAGAAGAMLRRGGVSSRVRPAAAAAVTFLAELFALRRKKNAGGFWIRGFWPPILQGSGGALCR